MPLAASSSGSYLPLLLIIGLFALMYLFMIRPQQRRQREIQQLQASMGPGDEVMTSSGMYGTVESVDEDATVRLEVSPGVTIRLARQAIMKVVTRAPREDDEADEPVEDPADDEG